MIIQIIGTLAFFAILFFVVERMFDAMNAENAAPTRPRPGTGDWTTKVFDVLTPGPSDWKTLGQGKPALGRIVNVVLQGAYEDATYTAVARRGTESTDDKWTVYSPDVDTKYEVYEDAVLLWTDLPKLEKGKK